MNLSLSGQFSTNKLKPELTKLHFFCRNHYEIIFPFCPSHPQPMIKISYILVIRTRNRGDKDPIFKKLNFKVQPQIVDLQAPETFGIHLEAMDALTEFVEKLDGVSQLEFVWASLPRQGEIDHYAPLIVQKLQGDGLVSFAYPKGFLC